MVRLGGLQLYKNLQARVFVIVAVFVQVQAGLCERHGRVHI